MFDVSPGCGYNRLYITFGAGCNSRPAVTARERFGAGAGEIPAPTVTVRMREGVFAQPGCAFAARLSGLQNSERRRTTRLLTCKFPARPEEEPFGAFFVFSPIKALPGSMVYLAMNFPSPFSRMWSARWLNAVLSPVVLLLGWHILVRQSGLPPFILPAPQRVGMRFLQVALDGSLLYHTLVTLGEIIPGLGIGAALAFILGYALAKSPRLERFLSPYLVASQATPMVAVAPLLVIWFGPGMTSKVLICALIVFFPVLVNTIVGLRSVPPDLRALMRLMRATPWQTFHLLELPAALPVLLGGLRVGATLAVIGAVVGEFMGADRGLGFLINLGRGQYDTALVFVAVATLVALALGLYALVLLLERRALAWQRNR